jgi:probable addiction module antidote protein
MNKNLVIKKSDFESLYSLEKKILGKDENRINSYIKTAFREYEKDGDIKALCLALKTAVKIRLGFTELAKKTGLNRENLYKTLSSKGNPTLHTLHLILSALNFHLKIEDNNNYKKTA